jgi:outer membrane protein assembly factor BamB
MVSGGLGLLVWAAAVGWLAEGRLIRLALIALGLSLCVWLFVQTPLDECNFPLDLRLRLGYLAPGTLLLAAQGLLFLLARRHPWPAAPSRWPFAVLLLLLSAVLFWRSNALRPETGLLRAVLCLDARTGLVMWNTPVFLAPTEKKHTLNSYATPTPATDGPCVYAHFGAGLAAVDCRGRLLWLNRDRDYHRFTRYGAGSSVVLADDLLIIYQDSEWRGHGDWLDYSDNLEKVGRRPSALIAYQKRDGKERWRIAPEFSHDSYMTPLVWPCAGRRQIVVATWKTLAGFALADGSACWSHPYPMQQIVPSLAANDGSLIVSGGNVMPYEVVAIRPPSPGQPAEARWSSQRGVSSIVSPICWDGLLFTMSDAGVLFCRDASTGEIHWSKRLRGRFLASLVAGDGKVYAVNEEGTLFVVAATTSGGLLAQLSLGESCTATPALAEGCLFIRTAEHLHSIAGEP